ncbi:MFS transporter [Microbacterium sp. bgisy189]|uniref:MFS transporter n=1 Tax=Microbacterium sp. bgisy189 TaxID=3413798 RepID=UPI003EBD4006
MSVHLTTPSTHTATPAGPPEGRSRRAVAAASIGTVLEWYDFFLYGTAAALVFPTLFFTREEPLTAILLSFAVYATGFIARPIGGLVSAHFGDRIGRRRTLLATLFVMGTATALIGVLPTYEQIGVAAPVLLVVLRFAQGAAAGGEWSGAALLALESVGTRRAVAGALVTSGLYVGLILGSLAFTIVAAAVGDEGLLAWGWRLPFLAGGALVLLGLYLRTRVAETPEFDRVVEGGDRERAPLRAALVAPRNVFAVFLVRFGQNVSFYVVSVFCLGYATTVLGMPKTVTLTALMVAAAVAAALCPVWALLIRRAAWVTGGALAALAVLAAPLFVVLDTRDATLVVAVLTLMIGIVNAAADGVQPAWLASLFDPAVRYSGMTIGREAAGIVGGGLAPLAATAMVAATGHWWPVATLMALAALVGAVGAVIARPVTR